MNVCVVKGCCLEVPGVDVRVILRWIVRKWGVWAWTGLSLLRIGTGDRLTGMCEDSIEPSGSIQCTEFLD